MKTGTKLIAEERERQISVEKWTPEHDDAHTAFQLSKAAIAYLFAAQGNSQKAYMWWPFNEQFRESSGELRDLVKAGALIAAEIDRLQRADDKKIKLHLTKDGKHVTGVEWNPEHWEEL